MEVKKLLIRALYGLHGEYIEFPDNPLHGKEYHNVNVDFKTSVNKIHGIEFTTDVIEIEGEEPIECEIICRVSRTDGTEIVDICQDWG